MAKRKAKSEKQSPYADRGRHGLDAFDLPFALCYLPFGCPASPRRHTSCTANSPRGSRQSNR